MIESQVHALLRSYLRSQGLHPVSVPTWPHHLTMARLVARALRLGRSALIQVDPWDPQTDHYQGYRLSYLMALLLWPGAALVVAAPEILERLFHQMIPDLQQWLSTHKPVCWQRCFPESDFQGVVLMSPQDWLRNALANPAQPGISVSDPTDEKFGSGAPRTILAVVEMADDLEDWILEQQTLAIAPADWSALKLRYPQQRSLIEDSQIYLTHSFFQHPRNPYDAYELSVAEQESVLGLWQELEHQGWQPTLPEPWQTFYRHCLTHSKSQTPYAAAHWKGWVTLDRDAGTFTLKGTEINLDPAFLQLWQQQPVVLIRETTDSNPHAGQEVDFALQHRLESITKVQFSAPQWQSLRLYVPDRLPLPNTPTYAAMAAREIRRLLLFSRSLAGLTVVLIQDYSLRQQMSTELAAEFGSRVRVNRDPVGDQDIVVASWDYWQKARLTAPTPALMIMTTLPFPSVEHPLVAARIAHYKHRKQDWFQNYLLPRALRDLQKAIAPLRNSSESGWLAILDTRIVYRTYGQHILSVLSPCTRISYLDPFALGEETRGEEGGTTDTGPEQQYKFE